MTRAELNAILDELEVGPNDDLLFVRKDDAGLLWFYEPIAYEGGFVIIKDLEGESQ